MLPALTPAPGLALHAHPVEQAPAGLSLRAGLSVIDTGGGSGWLIDFALKPPAGLKLPAPTSGGPADGLWRHTCLEAFVQDGAGPGYREFNFSPSGQWAVYRFDAERQRSPDDRPPPLGPTLAWDMAIDALRLRAWLPRTLLPDTPGAVGLSAVIETLDGQLSHWALHHPRADRPDFHHRAGWTAHPPLSPAPSSA